MEKRASFDVQVSRQPTLDAQWTRCDVHVRTLSFLHHEHHHSEARWKDHSQIDSSKFHLCWSKEGKTHAQRSQPFQTSFRLWIGLGTRSPSSEWKLQLPPFKRQSCQCPFASHWRWVMATHDYSLVHWLIGKISRTALIFAI